LNFLREYAARADVLDRPIAVFIAVRQNLHELNRMTALAKTLRHPVGLPAGKLTAACSDTQLS
jgi:hypothetical protein